MAQVDIGPWDTVSAALTALDEAGRPAAPAIENVGPHARAQGRHLAAIHRMHLRDIHAARNLLAQIEAGAAGAQDLVAAVPNMAMTQNYRAFGNLCGRECMILNAHHDIEEHHMFPSLERGGNAGINAVVEKLRAEHLVVHALLEQVYEAAVALVTELSEDSFAEARAVFEQLEAVVKSHFRYEETELEEAIGAFDAL